MLQYIKRYKTEAALASILLLAAFLTYYGAWNAGYGNSYYTAAVKSMLSSWHNFFFASFDAGGYITVDKPALGLWLQAISGAIFGVQGWSLILPEAVCAVASAALLYRMVRKSFGALAGLLAALSLSLTPIFIAASRTNNLDMSLILVLMCASEALRRAADRGSLRLLLFAMVFIGLGFNIKTLQAYLILPAAVAAYFFTARTSLGKRLWHLALGLVVLLGVSFAWILAVDLTPAEDRPYVGGSQNNSEMELMLSYNGIQRLIPGANINIEFGAAQERPPQNGEQPGQFSGGGQPGAMPSGSGADPYGQPGTTPYDNDARQGRIPFGDNGPQGGMQGNGPESRNDSGQGGRGLPMGGVGNEDGTPGILRLWNAQMGSQASWLTPFALFGILALALSLKKGQDNHKYKFALIFFGGWLITTMGFFSVAGFFHRYYLCMMAPAIAALTGIGLTRLWRFYKEDKGWRACLLPAAIAVTAVSEYILLSRYPAWSAYLTPVLAAGMACAIALAVLRILKSSGHKITRVLTAVCMAALLASPAAWSFTPMIFGTNTVLPIAGPELAQQGGGRGFGGGNWGGMRGESADDVTVEYLLQNYSGEKFLVAVPDANTAAPIILQTGKAVMAVGGFSGNDPALTVERLEEMVESGELRFFMTGGRMGSDSDIISWVQEHGKEVSIGGSGFGRGTLYDLKQ